jgi:hypothetical protein
MNTIHTRDIKPSTPYEMAEYELNTYFASEY